MIGNLNVLIVSKENLYKGAEEQLQLKCGVPIAKMNIIQPRKHYILRKYSVGIELTDNVFKGLNIKNIIEAVTALPITVISIWSIQQLDNNTIVCEIGIIGVEHLVIIQKCRSLTGMKELTYDTSECSIDGLFIRAKQSVIDRDTSKCRMLLENTLLSNAAEQIIVEGDCNGGLLRTNVKGINLIINVNTGKISKPYTMGKGFSNCRLSTTECLIELVGCMCNDTDCEVSFRLRYHSGETVTTSRTAKHNNGITSMRLCGFNLAINLETPVLKLEK